MKKFLTITAALSISLFAVACGEADDHDHEGPSDVATHPRNLGPPRDQHEQLYYH